MLKFGDLYTLSTNAKAPVPFFRYAKAPVPFFRYGKVPEPDIIPG